MEYESYYISTRHPMMPVGDYREREFSSIATSTNVAYSIFKQGRETEESAEYDVVGAPRSPLSPFPPQPVLVEERSYDMPRPLELPRQAPAMDIPPVPQNDGEKGPDEAIYETIPGDQ